MMADGVMTNQALATLMTRGTLPVKRERPLRAIGIDLGTTNSTVAEVFWEPGASAPVRARCLEIDQQTDEGLYTNVLVPSIVVLENGKILVGEGAKRARSLAGERGLRQNKNLFFDCKNEIGLRRTYHTAPAGFRNATEIAAKVLEFLRAAALAESSAVPDRTVVTVPASFQSAQRRDTLDASRLAGFEVHGGDLLDEPIAAFIDFVVSQGPEAFHGVVGRRRLVVFDFGGGTCDVAVLEVQFGSEGAAPSIAPLAVSRYHRLGGGDIDAAIIYETLLQQLLEQNGLGPFDLSFEEKKGYVEPALLGVAEALKIGLSTEIRRLESFGKYTGVDKTQIVKKQAGLHRFKVGDRALTLQSPSLTAAQFEGLLSPFLDADLLYAVEGEYRLSCSIFAPISDAIEKSGVERESIDFCLLVGGSSLIPQVQHAVSEYFSRATVLTYPDAIDLQMAVARGAAYHALALSATGRGVFQPFAHDDISIRTSSGLVTLVPRGAPLPVSADHAQLDRAVLTVPETALLEPCRLRVELVAGTGEQERVVFTGTWDIPGPVNKGEPLALRRELDENQVLSLELRLVDDAVSEPFRLSVENPLTHVSNPMRDRLRIEEREEALRTRQIPQERVPDVLVELADGYRELGHREKTLEYLRRALRAKGRPDSEILNKMGITCGEMGDSAREERFFREAASASGWAGPLFNLTLAQEKRGAFEDAARTIDEALGRTRLGPYLVLAAQIAQARGLVEKTGELLREARTGLLRPLPEMGDWELSWALALARLLPDAELQRGCEAERKRRQHGRVDVQADGMLPDLQPALSVQK
jgi:molecular chaperone DnaK